MPRVNPTTPIMKDNLHPKDHMIRGLYKNKKNPNIGIKYSQKFIIIQLLINLKVFSTKCLINE
jgi:hypothetical protein